MAEERSVNLQKSGGSAATAEQVVATSAELNAQLAESMVSAAEDVGTTPEERALVDEVEMGIRPKSFSVGGLVLLILTAAAYAGGAFWILGNEHLKENWALFWEGKLKDEAEKRAQAEYDRRAREDRATQNRYGEVNLFYSPRDAEVEVTRIAYKESMPEFVERYERGGEDKRQPAGTEPLKKISELTTTLKKNQYFQNLPIHDIPLVERSDDGTVFTYEYEIKITHHNEAGKQDYKPRTYLLHSAFSYHAPPPGVTPLRFQEFAGNNFVAPFNGCDLVPEPSIFKCTYADVMYKVKCDVDAAKKNKEQPLKPEEEPALADSLTMQYSGLPLDEWQSRVDELKNYTEDPTAWAQAQEIVEKCDCENALAACKLFKVEPPADGKPPAPDAPKGYCQDWTQPL